MFSNYALMNLGTPELLIILVIILLLFGGKKLPQLSRSIGESLREIRKGVDGPTEKENEKNKEKQPNQDNRPAA